MLLTQMHIATYLTWAGYPFPSSTRHLNKNRWDAALCRLSWFNLGYLQRMYKNLPLQRSSETKSILRLLEPYSAKKYLAMFFTGHVPLFKLYLGLSFCVFDSSLRNTHTHIFTKWYPGTFLKCYSSPSWNISPVCCLVFLFENINLIGLSFGGFFLVYLPRCISILHFHKKIYSNCNTTKVTARRSSKRNVLPKGLHNPILTRQSKIPKNHTEIM